MTDITHDPFEEESTSTEATEAVKTATEVKEESQDGDEEGKTQTGEETNTDGTPPADKEGTEGSGNEKMIPESRFKAAIKDVTSKLEAANNELATLKAAPVPDAELDPDGYNLHIRLETSKKAMRELTTDYDEVIKHYKDLADANPHLNKAVAEHPIPAKHAYDIAKKDLEIRELSNLKQSDEWKEFQAFKKAKSVQNDNKVAEEVSKKVAESLASKVPNLNRATNVSKGNSKSDVDDELFAGAL